MAVLEGGTAAGWTVSFFVRPFRVLVWVKCFWRLGACPVECGQMLGHLSQPPESVGKEEWVCGGVQGSVCGLKVNVALHAICSMCSTSGQRRVEHWAHKQESPESSSSLCVVLLAQIAICESVS